VILAWLFLEETLTWQKALGGAIILYGIYHGSRKPS
jgi:drug/metabolite transporter (DMT)-like permease